MSINPNDVQAFRSLLQTILATDNTARKQSELTLIQARKKDPDSFLRILIIIMKDQQLNIRFLSSIILKNNISCFTPNSPMLYNEIKPQTQSYIKEQLIQALNTEKQAQIRYNICDTIGDLAGTVYDQDREENG